MPGSKQLAGPKTAPVDVARSLHRLAEFASLHRLPAPPWQTWTRFYAGPTQHQYYQTVQDGKSVIVVDCQPLGPRDEHRRSVSPRAEVTVALNDYLNRIGCSTPTILAYDNSRKCLLLADVDADEAETSFFNHNTSEPRLVLNEDKSLAAIDALVHLQSVSLPSRLQTREGSDYPLIVAHMSLVEKRINGFPLLLNHFEGTSIDEGAQEEWKSFWPSIFVAVTNQTTVMCLRGFIAPKLFWRSNETGSKRVGILGYENAVRGHRAWDLATFLNHPGTVECGLNDKLREKLLSYYLESISPDERGALRDIYIDLSIAYLISVLMTYYEERPRNANFGRLIPVAWKTLLYTCEFGGRTVLLEWLSHLNVDVINAYIENRPQVAVNYVVDLFSDIPADLRDTFIAAYKASVAHNSQKKLRDILRAFIVSLSGAQTPPAKAPALYIPRKSGKASTFLKSHYGPWLDAGVLFRPLLGDIDPKLKRALDREFEDRPDDYRALLPTDTDRLDAELERIAGAPIDPAKRKIARTGLSMIKGASVK